MILWIILTNQSNRWNSSAWKGSQSLERKIQTSYWQPYPIMRGIFVSKLWGKIWSCFPKGNPTSHPTLICQLIEQHPCRAVVASTLPLDNIGYIERGGNCWSLIKSFPHLGLGEDTPVMPHCFSKTWVKSKSSMYWHVLWDW